MQKVKTRWLIEMAKTYSVVPWDGNKPQQGSMRPDDVARLLGEAGQTFSIEKMEAGELETSLKMILFKKRLAYAWRQWIPEMECPICKLLGKDGKWTKDRFPVCTLGGRRHYWVWKVSHLPQCGVDPLELLVRVEALCEPEPKTEISEDMPNKQLETVGGSPSTENSELV